MVFKLATISDIHLERNIVEDDFFKQINNKADLFIFGGDISYGKLKDVNKFLELISKIKIPILIVLGNHDKINNSYNIVQEILLTNPLVKILDGDYLEFNIDNKSIGIVGSRGYGGGFTSEDNTDRGKEDLYDSQKKMSKPTPNFILDLMNWEEEDKEVLKLKKALEIAKEKNPDILITINHWAPFKELIKGEKVEFYPLYGSSKLGDEIRKVTPNLILSGHSHRGPSGIIEVENKYTSCNISSEVNNKKMLLFKFLKNNNVKLEYL